MRDEGAKRRAIASLDSHGDYFVLGALAVSRAEVLGITFPDEVEPEPGHARSISSGFPLADSVWAPILAGWPRSWLRTKPAFVLGECTWLMASPILVRTFPGNPI